MSWSWRSKETYGDKSANFEGGEAEKPAADEGADKKAPKSIWEDTNDKWWEQYDTTRSTGGGTGSTTRDDAYRVYSYDDAFDDSDSRWYRRNSFKYDSYRDYSPSQLFRRSFTSIGFGGGYTTSGDNELKNKAIRALRSLTRNANTVADKAAKINYTVKFSAGADSNGSADVLAGKSGKQQEQIIYVSPDELATSETDDDVDSVIDALTGFVLLRVQISQGVDKDVIDEVNLTGMQAVPTRLAGLLVSGKISKEDAANAANTFTDDYAAGIMTKGLLTRLARRAVVKDWGGFAPYFVRHAKKFAAVREKLASANENGLMSIELLASQIAYNLVSDENPIPLDKGIEDIVAKHLGDELPAEKLLQACRNLVVELREHLAAADKLEAGKLESAMHEIMNELGEDGVKDAAEAQEQLENHLEDIANFMDRVHEEGFNLSNPLANTSAKMLEQLANAAHELRMAQKLSEILKSLSEPLKQGLTGGMSKNTLVAHAEHAKTNVENNVAHYLPRLSEFAKRHALETDKLKSANNPIDAGTDESARESVKKFIDNVQEMSARLEEGVKTDIKETRTKLADACEAAKADNAKFREMLQKMRDKAEELEKTAEKLAVDDPTANAPKDRLESFKTQFDEHIAASINRDRDLSDSSASAKKLKTVSSLSRLISNEHSRSESMRTAMRAISDSMRYGPSAAMNHFMSHAINAGTTAAYEADSSGKPYATNTDWHEAAKEAFFRQESEEQLDFTTALLNQTHKEMLNLLAKQLSAAGKKKPDSDGSSDDDSESHKLPETFRDLTAEQKALVKNVAASLGMNGQQLFNMLRQMQSSSKTGNAKAAALGRQLREKLIEPAAETSPVDEQLFGEQVKNDVKMLLGNSLDSVHDEATNSVEEDFVAYLSHNDARPKIKVVQQPTRHSEWAKKRARQIRNENRGAIDRVRDALIFQSDKRVGEVHGLASGDLDEGSLHKLQYDSEYIWSQKTLTRLPDVAVGILVDQSGSMSAGGKIDEAREMCIVLAEAVKQVPGVHLHIYGHTANRSGFGSDLQLFEHYSSHGDAQNADLSRLGAIEAMSNNYDGYAIKETAKLLSHDPAKKKYLFIIADGLPSGHGYGGKEAEKHVTSVCTYVRNKLKISTYAFGVGVHSQEHIRQFKTQYGENNVVFISTVKQALPKIVRFLRNVLHKERTLVDASAE